MSALPSATHLTIFDPLTNIVNLDRQFLSAAQRAIRRRPNSQLPTSNSQRPELNQPGRILLRMTTAAHDILTSNPEGRSGEAE